MQLLSGKGLLLLLANGNKGGEMFHLRYLDLQPSHQFSLSYTYCKFSQ